MIRYVFGIVALLLPELVYCQVCPQPDPPLNGQVNITDGFDSGSVVTYTCDTGYALVGSASRICLIDTTWNGQTPTCNKECSVLAGVTHGTVDLSLGNWANSIATYICDNNYALVGQSTRKCQSTGLWSGVEPKCQFAMFPDILIVFGVFFILLIMVDIVVLIIFLYKKVYMRKKDDDDDEEEEIEEHEPEHTIEEKKSQLLPFMLERPVDATLPPPRYPQGKKSKYSRITPEITDDPEVRMRTSVHPPPRKPHLGHPKVEKMDRPSFLKTPRDKKGATFGREKTFEATTFGPDKNRFKPEMVLKPTMTGSYATPLNKEHKQVNLVDERPGKDGYNTGNSDDSNTKRAPSPAEADQLSLEDFDLPDVKANSSMNRTKSPSLMATFQTE